MAAKWRWEFDLFDWDFMKGSCRKHVRFHGVCLVDYWCIGPLTVERAWLNN